MILSSGGVSPWQTITTHSITGGWTVALLEAVDESTVQAGLALLQAPVLFEATAPTGHTPGIVSIAKATFLRGLSEEIHWVRGRVGDLKEGMNVDYRGSRIKEWSWPAGSENNGLPPQRVHLTLTIISLTLSVWMTGLPLQDPERPGIWIIKDLGDTHCCIIASLLLRFCVAPSPSRLSECPVDWETSKQRKCFRKGARIMERYMEKIRWILFLCSTI